MLKRLFEPHIGKAVDKLIQHVLTHDKKITALEKRVKELTDRAGGEESFENR